MADTFPTALQRTSDERWVNLQAVSCSGNRYVARLDDDAKQAAVVRLAGGEPYDRHLRRLLTSPPPDAGRGVHLSWPIDLLRDETETVIGYTARRHGGYRSVPLDRILEPTFRGRLAAEVTRRHMLRMARNMAAAVAALHHVGHGSIATSNFRIDGNSRAVVVGVDSLQTDVTNRTMLADRRCLADAVVGLLGWTPWESEGPLGSMLLASGTTDTAPEAGEWFHSLRVAERSSKQNAGAVTTPVTPSSKWALLASAQ